MGRHLNSQWKKVDLGNGLTYGTIKNMNKALRAYFAAGFNKQPFTGRSMNSTQHVTWAQGNNLRHALESGEMVICYDGMLRPNRQDWSSVEESMRPLSAERPFTRLQEQALALLEGSDPCALLILNSAGHSTINAVTEAYNVLKVLAPHGICWSCVDQVTPATAVPEDAAHMTKVLTAGLCDKCRALSMDRPQPRFDDLVASSEDYHNQY